MRAGNASRDLRVPEIGLKDFKAAAINMLKEQKKMFKRITKGKDSTN